MSNDGNVANVCLVNHENRPAAGAILCLKLYHTTTLLTICGIMVATYVKKDKDHQRPDPDSDLARWWLQRLRPLVPLAIISDDACVTIDLSDQARFFALAHARPGSTWR